MSFPTMKDGRVEIGGGGGGNGGFARCVGLRRSLTPLPRGESAVGFVFERRDGNAARVSLGGRERRRVETPTGNRHHAPTLQQPIRRRSFACIRRRKRWRDRDRERDRERKRERKRERERERERARASESERERARESERERARASESERAREREQCPSKSENLIVITGDQKKVSF